MSDMVRDRDPDASEEPDPGQGLSWWRKGLLVLLAVIGATLLAGLVWFALFVTHYGDPAPAPGIVVDNQTAGSLNVYVMVGQEPVLSAEIPPRSRVATGITCARAKMIAKDSSGHLVAQRGPLPGCDQSDWVISTVSLAPSPSPTAG
jgi:hypothetical protein